MKLKPGVAGIGAALRRISVRFARRVLFGGQPNVEPRDLKGDLFAPD